MCPTEGSNVLKCRFRVSTFGIVIGVLGRYLTVECLNP